MITDDQLPELATLRKVESKYPFRVDPNYGSSVIFGNNSGLPIHRWFRYKEAFSADLLKQILDVLPDGFGKQIRLLDPFCGVGTSLLAAQEIATQGYNIIATGIEQNPFVAFVARAKVNWPEINARDLVRIGLSCEKKSKGITKSIPPLSSLTSGKCISRYMSKRVLAIAEAVRSAGTSATHNAIMLGLASVIETVSNTRKDGRALRVVTKKRSELAVSLEMAWEAIAADTALLQWCLPRSAIPKVILGDGRRPLCSGVQPGTIDLVITSPPYPNNIDYSEVYKLELWLLGLIKSQDSFLKLRKSTFRSHPTCAVPDDIKGFNAAIRRGFLKAVLDPIIGRTEKTSEPWRKRVLLGYFSDMWVALEEQKKCLKKGGYAVTVVGNSLHGSTDLPYLIPSDITIAQIAERIGFRVHDIIISRPLKRRLSGNHFLRESIIILQKPR